MPRIGIFQSEHILLGTGATIDEALAETSRICGGVRVAILQDQLRDTNDRVPDVRGLYSAPLSSALENDREVKAGKPVRTNRFEVNPDGTLDVRLP